MKLRWTHESVRFRITPTELATLLRGETVQTRLTLPGGGFWAATLCATEGETRLDSDQSEVILRLSHTDRQKLSTPELEGIYYYAVADGDLSYLVEKDYPCVHPRAMEALEPKTETFAPPPGFEERKSVAS